MIWINSENVRHLPTPFGGMKASGVGRDGGDRERAQRGRGRDVETVDLSGTGARQVTRPGQPGIGQGGGEESGEHL